MSGANTLNDKIPTSSKNVRLLGKKTLKKAKKVFKAFLGYRLAAKSYSITCIALSGH
jgi:hypothetical protein